MLALELAGKSQDRPSGLVEVPFRRDPHVDVNAAAARCLGPSSQARFGDHVSGGQGRLSNMPEVKARSGIKVDSQLVRAIGVFGSSRPRMKVEAAELGELDHVGLETGHDHHSGPLRREPNLDRFEGRVLVGSLVIDGIDLDALHVALEHRRAAENPPESPFRHDQEVIHDVELGPPLFGEQQLSRAADPNGLAPGFDHGFVGHSSKVSATCPNRLPCSQWSAFPCLASGSRSAPPS